MAPLRLPALALAVAAGIVLSEHTGRFAAAPAPWLAALAVLILGGAGSRRAPRARWLVGAVLVGGAVAASDPGVAAAPPDGAIADDRDVDRLVGTIRGPITRADDRAGARLVTDGDATAVWVWAPLPLAPGDRVAITGRLRTPRGYRNPGEPDRAGLARLRDAAYEASATRVEHLGVAGDVPWRWADGVRRRWSTTIAASATGRAVAAAIVRGSVVGDRGAITDATDDAWRGAGVYHVLSVSGLHLAVVALLGYVVLRRAIAGLGVAPAAPPARWAALPALAAAAAYTVITGAEVATLRALVVVAVMVAGAALGRPVRIADAIGAAAVALLVYRPASIHDPSFQLSFIAAGVLAAIPARRRRPRPGGRVRRAGASIGRAVIASAWVTAATAPITAAAFGQIAWGGLIGNLVVTPVIELVVIPATLIGLAIAVAVPVAGCAVIAAAVALTDLVDHLIAAIAAVTPVIAIAPPTSGELALAVASWVVPFLAYRGRLRVWPALVVTAAVVAALVAARQLRGAALGPPGALVVTFLDVGQGDAAVIETPAGETWLVDAGGQPGLDVARAIEPGRAVARFLAARGRDRVDLAVISHAHPDHYLGLLALLEHRVEIRTVLVAVELTGGPPCAGPGCLAAVLDRLRAAGTRVVVPPLGLAHVSGGAALHVLAPRYRPVEPALVAAGDPVRSVNDNSLVVAVAFAGRRVLFTGDLEAEGELEVAAGGRARADVVKVAHHGSATSSRPAFVAATGASLAVISCGRGNRFGFPRPSTLARWSAAGARIRRTDLDGAVTVTIDPAGRVLTATHAAGRTEPP